MSSILRRVVYPAMSHAGIYPALLRRGNVCVLTYHGIFPKGYQPCESPTDQTLLTADQFRRQLRFLKSRYQLITPELFRSWILGEVGVPKRAVLLTCDDGLLNALTEMLPILQDEGLKCLFFVTGAPLENQPACLWYDELFQVMKCAETQRNSGDARGVGGDTPDAHRNWGRLLQEFSALDAQQRREAMDQLRKRQGISTDQGNPLSGSEVAERRYRLLNRDEVQELASAGMTVGAHTVSHPMLSLLNRDLAEAEIQECRAQLELCLQREVWAVAFPFGDKASVGEREAEIAERAGYLCAFLNGGEGGFDRSAARFRLPRSHVSSRMTIPELEARLTGFTEVLRKRVTRASAQGK